MRGSVQTPPLGGRRALTQHRTHAYNGVDQTIAMFALRGQAGGRFTPW